MIWRQAPTACTAQRERGPLRRARTQAWSIVKQRAPCVASAAAWLCIPTPGKHWERERAVHRRPCRTPDVAGRRRRQQRALSSCVRVPAWSPAGAGLGMSSPPPPPVSGEVGDWASYAVAQRHSKKQEDKFLLKVLSTGGTPSWADFCCAVLDGHNGRRAAETCAARLPSIVSEELARLCAASGVTYDAHADAASPNWHPQVRTPALSCSDWLDPALGRRAHAAAGQALRFLRTRPPRRGGTGSQRRKGANGRRNAPPHGPCSKAREHLAPGGGAVLLSIPDAPHAAARPGARCAVAADSGGALCRQSDACVPLCCACRRSWRRRSLLPSSGWTAR